MKRIYEWWKQHVAHKSDEARKKHIEEIRRRYDILAERERFIAAAMKKEGLDHEA